MTIYSRNNPPVGFYVYAYIRTVDSEIAKAGTPYYIGKGYKKRAWSKGKSETKPPINNHYIVILESGLSNLGALAIERRMIRWYGKIIDGTGILRNKQDGGDGSTPGANNRVPWNKGKKSSPETIQKQKDAIANRTEETNLKMIESGKRSYEKTFALLTKEQRQEKYKNSLGRLTTEQRKEIGRKNENKGGDVWSKASAGQVTVTDKFGKSKRVPQSLFTALKNDMISNNTPVSEWEFVQVSSNEAKRRRNNNGN